MKLIFEHQFLPTFAIFLPWLPLTPYCLWDVLCEWRFSKRSCKKQECLRSLLVFRVCSTRYESTNWPQVQVSSALGRTTTVMSRRHGMGLRGDVLRFV